MPSLTAHGHTVANAYTPLCYAHGRHNRHESCVDLAPSTVAALGGGGGVRAFYREQVRGVVC